MMKRLWAIYLLVPLALQAAAESCFTPALCATSRRYFNSADATLRKPLTVRRLSLLTSTIA